MVRRGATLTEIGQILQSVKPGLFLTRQGDAFSLWDLRVGRRVKMLYRRTGVYLCEAQDNSVYFVTPREIVVLENVLNA